MSREFEIYEAFQVVSAKQSFFSPEDVNTKWNPAEYRGVVDPTAGGRLATVRAVLRTLEALGLVRRAENGMLQATSWQRERERLAIRARADSFPPGGLPPPPDGDNQGGGQGGDGFREVLSHPYLFALPTADFDRLLESI